MTTPVIRHRCRAAGVNTAELHYADCCCCLLPGSRLCLQSFFLVFFFFYNVRSRQEQTQNYACSFSHTYTGLEPERDTAPLSPLQHKTWSLCSLLTLSCSPYEQRQRSFPLMLCAKLILCLWLVLAGQYVHISRQLVDDGDYIKRIYCWVYWPFKSSQLGLQ